MPGCLRGRDNSNDADKQDAEWREPPGYLGEAVRRAKRIPRRPPPETPKD